MANRIELMDAKGQFKMPTREAIEAANFDETAKALFATVEQCDAAVIEAAAAIESAKAIVNDKAQALADAQKHLDSIRPKISAVQAVREFIETGKRR